MHAHNLHQASDTHQISYLNIFSPQLFFFSDVMQGSIAKNLQNSLNFIISFYQSHGTIVMFMYVYRKYYHTHTRTATANLSMPIVDGWMEQEFLFLRVCESGILNVCVF